MSRGNIGVRAILLTVGLPVFFVLIYFLPYYKHLGLNLGVMAVTAAGALELERLLAARGSLRIRALAVLSALVPAAVYLEVLGVIGPAWFPGVLVVLLGGALLNLLRVSRQEELPPLLHNAGGAVLVLLYPAMFASFIVRITGLPRPAMALFFFFALNFGSDILAYLLGTYLGRRTRLGYLVSPNKSIVGFVAGLGASIGIALLVRGVFPGFFPVSYPAAAAFGFGMGALTIAGDLIESAFKRSAGVKDSGGTIPGRGGVLDSIDSWLFSAPLFYFVFRGLSGYIAP
ncbi:MAG: phosphatidate cytidylyltransferase [Spirochaetales bacterium]|nr:phosphatidate cytidylyltransferase [Spirochaetales bacterium]